MTKKNNKKSTFWKRIRFKYKLSFLNENTLEEVFSFHLSRLSAFLTIAVFAGLMIALTSIIIINTPIRNYLPGYLDKEVRDDIMTSALRIDSLEQVLNARTAYLHNIGSILRGEVEVDAMQENAGDSLIDLSQLNIDRSKKTEEFVNKFEEEERYNLTVLSSSGPTIPENTIFYKPVKGIISSHFNINERHYGTDIAANMKESVLATLKGTVIFTGFDANAGYVIQVQHRNGFTSIYKHNAMLLKKMGDEVEAGEAIALVGNTGNYSTGTHLHFELWYNGVPIDPEEYIIF
jgi:Membrane proteins related to metalloendopeptidases